MIYSLYAIYDKKVGFMPIVCQQNDGCAMRSFETAIMKSNDDLGTHPDDFELYFLGKYNSETGYIEPEKRPHLLITGAQVDAWRKEV